MKDLHRIMYASDFSALSLVAFPHAIRMARLTGAELVIIHVLPSPIPLIGEMTSIDEATWERMFAGARAEAHKQLDVLIEHARAAGIQTSAFVVDDVGVPAPADEIVRAAREQAVDLLVLGTHGRTGVARFFLGSVAARIVATAPCPVLSVRPPTPAERPARDDGRCGPASGLPRLDVLRIVDVIESPTHSDPATGKGEGAGAGDGG